jgi:hypothetical protein
MGRQTGHHSETHRRCDPSSPPHAHRHVSTGSVCDWGAIGPGLERWRASRSRAVCDGRLRRHGLRMLPLRVRCLQVLTAIPSNM